MASASGRLGAISSLPRDWKITAARASIDKLVYQIVFPYLGVYIVGLGASGTDLGLANGVGMAVSAFYGLLGVYLMHRHGTKKVYIAGLVVTAFSYLVLGIAWSWLPALVGVVAWWWGNAETGLCCNVVCGSSLGNRVRATAMGACESVAQGTMSFIGPAIGAALIALAGGMSVPSVRPLFFVAFLGELGCLYFVARKLGDSSNSRCERRSEGHDWVSTATSFFHLLRREPRLWRFVAMSCLANLPTGMVLPFTQLFASENKSASPYVLGAMVTGSALVSLVAGVPLGRMADKVGRKKTLFLLAPFFLASNLLLVFGGGPFLLVASGVCLGAFPITLVVSAAMAFEQVPAQEIGDWMAVLRFFRLLLGAILAIISGLIWDGLGGRWVFLLAAAIDLFVRLPLLATMPETLGAAREASSPTSGRAGA